MFFFDPVVMLIALVGAAFSGWAALRVQTAFNTYSQVRSRTGYTAAQAADIMLHQAGINNVEIVPVQGHLSDHYDPVHKRLALLRKCLQQHVSGCSGYCLPRSGSRHSGCDWLRGT